MVMRYLWLPFRLVLWAIPTALVSLFWNAHAGTRSRPLGWSPWPAFRSGSSRWSSRRPSSPLRDSSPG